MISLAYIDHYDSFTFNLIAWLEESEHEVAIRRIAYDDPKAMAEAAVAQWPLVVSPGPKSPREARATVDLVKACLGKVPILGVCLGHQILAQVAGLAVGKSERPMHGAVKHIYITDHAGIFAGMDTSCGMAAYHSLVAIEAPLAYPWQITAHCQYGEVQALEYRPSGGAWAFGLQFHPESFLSRGSRRLLDNWYSAIDDWQRVKVGQPLRARSSASF